ncbi:MAG: tryptophan synthase subunit alpha [Oscillospiraceae bacterium]|nr:tryptophan synthase subunit alpha [Oscillospiraceae bacterium]
MNRIQQVFDSKRAIIPFVTGGDPDIQTTERLILALAEAGADMIEIGIPFSDPAAGGPVLQLAEERALTGGCRVAELFELVARVREQVTIPLLFRSYINPIFVYGPERFMSDCARYGIDGVVVLDLPFEEQGEIRAACKAHGILQVSTISPAPVERLQKIAKAAEGFLYCIGDFGAVEQSVRQVTEIPIVAGYGAPGAETANGVVVDTAIVELVAELGRDSVASVVGLLQGLR